MGIVSISLFILALSGPVHLFNSVSWVENLQSRLTFDPPYLPYVFSQGSTNVDRSCFKETLRKAFVASSKRLFPLPLFSRSWIPLSLLSKSLFPLSLCHYSTARWPEWNTSLHWSSSLSVDPLWRVWLPLQSPTLLFSSSSSRAHLSPPHRNYKKYISQTTLRGGQPLRSLI